MCDQSNSSKDQYVNFGDVCRNRLSMQCQYGSRYLQKPRDGNEPPDTYLGDGLRILGEVEDYHSLRIHQGDVEEFVRRVARYKLRRGIWGIEEHGRLIPEDIKAEFE